MVKTREKGRGIQKAQGGHSKQLCEAATIQHSSAPSLHSYLQMTLSLNNYQAPPWAKHFADMIFLNPCCNPI